MYVVCVTVPVARFLLFEEGCLGLRSPSSVDGE